MFGRRLRIRARHGFGRGRPIIEGNRVAAEFWVTRSNDGEEWTTAGCLIARLDPEGRCSFFREYWFDVQGHTSAYEGWGE